MFSTFSPIFTIYVQRNISSIKYSALIMLLFNKHSIYIYNIVK